MPKYTVRPRGPDTWDAYAALIERHNGVWGDGWCLAFHPTYPARGQSLEGNRALKRRLVHEGPAHAAVVFDADRAIGWCQYGTPAALPSIDHRKEYEATLVEPPAFRVTSFFVDRDDRREGVSAVALGGALELIAQAGDAADAPDSCASRSSYTRSPPKRVRLQRAWLAIPSCDDPRVHETHVSREGSEPPGDRHGDTNALPRVDTAPR